MENTAIGSNKIKKENGKKESKDMDKEIKKDTNEEIIEDPRKVFSDALVVLGTKNPNVLYISCDSSLGASGAEFNKRFPERHFEFGIQEQNAMGEAAGFALCGKVPFIAAYVPFITFRCFEQIRDDVCKTNLNVNIMGNNCGFSVSALGPTHVILEDVSIMRSIPNMTIISPCDGPEYYQTVLAAAELDGPVYIRIHRQKTKRLHSGDYKFEIGKGEILRKGSDITVIACSSMIHKTLEASAILAEKGIGAEVINISTIKPIDKNLIVSSTLKTKRVVTVEEHSIVNGLGSAVADVLAKENPLRMCMIGINDVFAVVGEYDEVLDYYGLTAPKVAQKIENFIAGNV
jgi:transketolase